MRIQFVICLIFSYVASLLQGCTLKPKRTPGSFRAVLIRDHKLRNLENLRDRPIRKPMI